MNWNILGIKPTNDKKAITAAYRARLRQTNPEDKPDEFKVLRAAYEEALQLADREVPDASQDNSPVAQWVNELSALYKDFSSRIDPEKWRILLSADVCIALDYRPAAEDALLNFLLEHYYIPRSVISLIDETFLFTQRIGELQEKYPKEFLDNVIINGTRLDPSLPYELFEPGVDGDACDAFIRLYFQMSQEEPEDLAHLLEQLDGLSEKHPYGALLRIRYRAAKGEQAEADTELRKLAETYPNAPLPVIEWADRCLQCGNIEEAKALLKGILDQYPDYFRAKDVLAKCYAACRQYDLAKELIFDCVRSSGSDPILANYWLQQLNQWNDELIPMREAKMESDPSDADNMIELAWCYIQNDRIDDAVRVSERMNPSNADTFKYHNLMGKLYLNQQLFAEALIHFRNLESHLKNMSPDGTAETEKRLNRLPEVLQLEGTCLMQTEQNEEARIKFEEALRLAPEDLDVLILMGKILHTTGDYEYAVEVLKRAIALAPDRWHVYLLLAMNLYRLHQDPEAFETVNRGLAFQPNDLTLYAVKLQILVRNSAWEEVHAILDFLHENGVSDDLSIEFIKAQLTEKEKENKKAAFAQYQKLARRVENGEQMMWAPELYYNMASLMSDSMNMDSEEDRELLIAMLDKGLSHNDQDQDCLAYKAWILQQGGRLRDAIDLYRGLMAKNSRSVAAQRGLSELYYDNLSLYAKEALEHYERMLVTKKTSEMYFYAAEAKRQLGDLEGARRYYLMELDIDPDDADAYNGLAYICDTEGKYNDSLSYLDLAIEAMKRLNKRFMWIFEHKALVLRRLERFEEALGVIDYAMQSYEYFAGNQLKFDICCQWGKWDLAKKVLDIWKKALPSDPALMQARAKLYMLTSKPFKAVLAMSRAKRSIPLEDTQSFQLQISELACNFDQQIEIWRRRVKANANSDYAYLGLARALFWSGRKEKAAEAAQKAVELLDIVLDRSLTDEALFRSRRSLALALLGRTDEAKSELAKTRGLPLCEACPYGSCKDADIYEAEIEEVVGNNQKALQLFHAGRAQWPDELDFAVGEARCRRRGK